MNLSYLRQFDNDLLPSQATDAESPDPVIAVKDPSEDEFKVTSILDAHNNRLYRSSIFQFRVAWLGWPDDPTWYNTDDDEFSHAKDALDDFDALPSAKVRPPRSAGVSPPSSCTNMSWGEPYFPGRGWCYGPQALYTFPTSPYLISLNPLPYIPHLVHMPLFKSSRLISIT